MATVTTRTRTIAVRLEHAPKGDALPARLEGIADWIGSVSGDLPADLTARKKQHYPRNFRFGRDRSR